MLKHLIITALAATLAVGISYAGQQKPSKVTIPVGRTDASDGGQMFTSYCAPCHGKDGKGHGPVAQSLKTQPADLTLLKKNNNGKYPDSHVMAILQFGTEVNAHGNATMPVWGPILGTMNRTTPEDKLLRLSNLSRYIQTIQAK